MAIMFNPAISSGVSFQGKKNKVNPNAVTNTHIRPATAKTVGSRVGHNLRMLTLGLLSLFGVSTTQLFTSCTPEDIDIPVTPKDTTVVPEKSIKATAQYNQEIDILGIRSSEHANEQISSYKRLLNGEITEVTPDYANATDKVFSIKEISYTQKYPDDKAYFVVTKEPIQDSIGWYNEKTYGTGSNFNTEKVTPSVRKRHLVDSNTGILQYNKSKLEYRLYPVAKDSLNQLSPTASTPLGIKIFDVKYAAKKSNVANIVQKAVKPVARNMLR